MKSQLLLIAVLASACSSSGSTISRDGSAGPSDALTNISLPDLPPGCPPDAGNENGIGKPCTANGNECTGSLQCSCKNWFGYMMPSGLPCFCTNVSFGNTCTSCGSKTSCCTFDVTTNGSTVTVSGCFPSVCLADNKCPTL
jgi:hypothetical protein